MGFRKIKKYFSSKGVLDTVFGRAVLAFGTVKCTPYSMMKYYKSFQYLPDNKAKGIKSLMEWVEPLIKEVDKPDEVVKRKFRYTWEKMWQSFGEACHLSTPEVQEMGTIGLALPLFLSAVVLDDADAQRVIGSCRIYNTVSERKTTGFQSREKYLSIDDVNFLCAYFNAILTWHCITERALISEYEWLVTLMAEHDADAFISFIVTGSLEENDK